MKSSFLWRNRIALVSSAMLILALHLLSIGVRPNDRAVTPESLLLELLRPIQLGTTRLGEGTIQLFRGYIDLIGVQRDNTRLKAELDRLNTERTAAAELMAENRRLGELLDIKHGLQTDAVAADVIGSDATGLSRTLVISRGASGGLKAGMAVVSSEGVVGKVIATSLHASRVLLIDDHNSALDVFDQRTRARGIVAGVPDDGLTMEYVDRADDLKPGDPLVTSGLDGIFPRGLLVGYVIAVRREGPGLFLSVDVGPAVNFKRLEQVLVVTQMPPKAPEPAKG